MKANLQSITKLKILLVVLFIALGAIGCRKTYATPLASLVDSPAFLSPESVSNLKAVYQEKIEDDVLLIYMPSGPGPHASCMGVAFVSKNRSGWRAQSTSALVCESENELIDLGGLIGGNVRDLAVAYGRFDESKASKVVVVWDDGLKEQATIIDGVFINYRLETVLPVRVDLLNGNDELILSTSY